MNDSQILQLLWDRLEEAIDALNRRFGAGLYRMAMNILSNPPDAEETVQDTWMALWNAIPPQHPDPLTPYVYRTGRNLALKRLRAEQTQKRSHYQISLEELSDFLGGDSMEDRLDAKVLGQAIGCFLDTLSPQHRTLFLRRYWFGDSVTDLAVRFSMTPGAVSTRLNRLRTQLKDYLYKEGILE